MTRRTRPVDAYVTALERRLDPFRRADPSDPAQRRRQAAEFDVIVNSELGVTPIPAATEEHVLPVPGHPDVRLRVYWPGVERAASSAGGGLPIFVYFYGGGFTIAGIDWVGWDAGFRERARDAGVIIVAGEYSHAPEVRFPAQPEQCWTVVEWAVGNARSLGGDPANVAVGGASSGGNLAAVTTLMNRDRNRHPLRLQLLEAPALDLTMRHVETAGIGARVPGVILRKMGRMLVRQYLGDLRVARTDPYASPLRAASFEDLPPAVVYTSELDPLRGDGEEYVRRLSAAGVPATGIRYVGQTHTSGGLRRHVPSADHLHRDIVATLRTLHEPAPEYADPRVR